MTGTAPVLARIPHRPPALLLDRVARVEPGRALTAQWKHDPGSSGPFSSRQRTPGRSAEATGCPMGLLLESWTQAAAVLACWDRPSPDVRSGLLVLLAAVRDTRLVAPVPEGAVVTHDVLVVRDLGNTFLVAGESTVDGSTVLEAGQVTLALRPAEQVPGAGPATIPADEPSAEREGP